MNLPVENARVFETIQTWDLVQQADVIISVPKLKTRDQTEMTCSIKKLKGLLTDKNKKTIIGDRAEADRMYADENPPEGAA